MSIDDRDDEDLGDNELEEGDQEGDQDEAEPREGEPVEIVNVGPIATQLVNLPLEVQITSIRLPWGDMFKLIIQFMICAVPAILIVWMLWMMFFGAICGTLLGALVGHH